MTLTRSVSSEEPEPECEGSGLEREKEEDWRQEGHALFKASLCKEDKGKEQQFEKGWSCWRVS